jgi:predicted nucleic acid-binding protein
MKVFCDTSVLVAAADAEHVHHERSIKVIRGVKAGEAYCAMHSLAEFYTTMTRYPRRGMRISPALAIAAVRDIMKTFSAVGLTANEYVSTLERTAAASVTGAVVHDALILRCAEKIDADIVFTWNVADFQRVAPTGWAPKIQAP